ncbi:MAG: hypothetical protein LUD82_03885 [Clostridiales bacterium]|nr:hypothetical protein [Clostridiales bacterium]
MKKTQVFKMDAHERRSVDTPTLQAMLGVGRQAAVAVGTAAGARIQVGRRVLWNVQKDERYLNSIGE